MDTSSTTCSTSTDGSAVVGVDTTFAVLGDELSELKKHIAAVLLEQETGEADPVEHNAVLDRIMTVIATAVAKAEGPVKKGLEQFLSLLGEICDGVVYVKKSLEEAQAAATTADDDEDADRKVKGTLFNTIDLVLSNAQEVLTVVATGLVTEEVYNSVCGDDDGEDEEDGDGDGDDDDDDDDDDSTPRPPSSTASSGDGSHGSGNTGQSTDDDDSDGINVGATTPFTYIRRANTTGITTPSSPPELPGVAAPTPGQLLEQLPPSVEKELRLKIRKELEAEALALEAKALAANDGADELDAAKRDAVAARMAQKRAEEEVARQAKEMEEMKVQLVVAVAENQKQKDNERATSSTGTPSWPNGEVGSLSPPFTSTHFTSTHTPRRGRRSSILGALSAAGRILSPRTEKSLSSLESMLIEKSNVIARFEQDSECDNAAAIRTLQEALTSSSRQYELLKLSVLKHFIFRISESPTDLAHVENVAADTLAVFVGRERALELLSKSVKSGMLGLHHPKGHIIVSGKGSKQNDDDDRAELTAMKEAVNRGLGRVGQATQTVIADKLKTREASAAVSTSVAILFTVGVMKRLYFADLSEDAKEGINHLAAKLGIPELKHDDQVTTAYDCWQNIVSQALGRYDVAPHVAVLFQMSLCGVLSNEKVRDALNAEASTPVLSGSSSPARDVGVDTKPKCWFTGKKKEADCVRNPMQTLFSILLSGPTEEQMLKHLRPAHRSTFKLLPILLRNPFSNTGREMGSLIWYDTRERESDPLFYLFVHAKMSYDGKESTKTFNADRLFKGLSTLLENATRDEKEDQIDEKYFLMKSTASNVELLSRHLSISLTTNDSEDS